MAPRCGVGIGKDHTIFAVLEGRVSFAKGFKGRTFISVEAAGRSRGVTPFPYGFSRGAGGCAGPFAFS